MSWNTLQLCPTLGHINSLPGKGVTILLQLCTWLWHTFINGKGASLLRIQIAPKLPIVLRLASWHRQKNGTSTNCVAFCSLKLPDMRDIEKATGKCVCRTTKLNLTVISDWRQLVWYLLLHFINFDLQAIWLVVLFTYKAVPKMTRKVCEWCHGLYSRSVLNAAVKEAVVCDDASVMHQEICCANDLIVYFVIFS